MQSEENTKPVVSDCVMGCMCLFFLGTSKRRRKDELAGKNVKRSQHELDHFGLVPLPVKVCYTCNRYTILRVDIYSDHIHHTSSDHLPTFLVFFPGAAGCLRWSSVIIAPSCSTWTVWTRLSLPTLQAGGCVPTTFSTW